MQETHLPPHDASPREKELWKKADRKRRQNANPLVIEVNSVTSVTSGSGADSSPKIAQRKPVTTRTVIRPK